MPQSIHNWANRIGAADATHRSDSEAAADLILMHMRGYRNNSTFRSQDVAELANAIQAYAKLLQDAGVTVV